MPRLAALPVVFAAWLAGAVAIGDAPGAGRPPAYFDIDLDAAPERRFDEVLRHFNGSLQRFYDRLNVPPIMAAFRAVSRLRGPEDPELMAEIEGMAETAALPVFGLHVIAMIYELNEMIVPYLNITWPFSGTPAGCMGIIAQSKANGMVYHGRNLDFSPAEYLQDLVYMGIFRKGGKEVFRSQMVAGYSMPLTALRKGRDGYSWEINTRFADHHAGKLAVLHNLFTEKRTLNGWTTRKILETTATYEAAVAALSSAKLVTLDYNVISGVRKGAILARGPDGVAHMMTLGEPNVDCRDDYIIISNFDYFNRDLREWLDYTGGGGVGHPRRLAAQRVLNASASLSPDVVLAALSAHEVQAFDTIFRAVINVETGEFDAFLPPCSKCPSASPALGAAASAGTPAVSETPPPPPPSLVDALVIV